MKRKYVAKPNTWFDAGTEASLVDEIFPDYGLFEGWRTCQNQDSEGVPVGTRYIDQESCNFDEFNIVETED